MSNTTKTARYFKLRNGAASNVRFPCINVRMKNTLSVKNFTVFRIAVLARKTQECSVAICQGTVGLGGSGGGGGGTVYHMKHRI